MSNCDLITEGRALLDAATPGPWTVRDDNSEIGGWPPSSPLWCIDNEAYLSDDDDEPAVSITIDVGVEADADLVAWARNNLTTLLDEITTLRAAYAELQRDTQQAYTAIHAKQQRDAQRIAALESGGAA